MKPFRVQIMSYGCLGGMVLKTVFAKTSKAAFSKVIEELPETHAAWQWAGWQVQVFEENYPFIVQTEKGTDATTKAT